MFFTYCTILKKDVEMLELLIATYLLVQKIEIGRACPSYKLG